MISARKEILGRIRGALDERRGPLDIPASVEDGPRSGPIPRFYRRRGALGPGALLDLLQDRIADYEASVVRGHPNELAHTIFRRLEGRGALPGALRLAVPSGVPKSWLEELSPPGFEIIRDLGPDPLSNAQLGSVHGVLTGCAAAIAETGTLILDGGATQGRRCLSLLPDYHLCVVSQSQIVETVPEAVDLLRETLRERRAPITLISGPSATSDIELIRVEGVHGPRNLDVILVEDV